MQLLQSPDRPAIIIIDPTFTLCSFKGINLHEMYKKCAKLHRFQIITIFSGSLAPRDIHVLVILTGMIHCTN